MRVLGMDAIAATAALLALSTGCGPDGSDGPSIATFGSASQGTGTVAGTETAETSEPTEGTTGDDGVGEYGEIGGPDGSSAGESGDSGPNPAGEVCNGLDDNLDGTIDEGFGEVSCGMGACATSASECVGGMPQVCVPLMPGAESCNGLDDDCDGEADEALSQPCSTACGDGSESCTAGVWGNCTAPPAAAEVCDAVDQDCDGSLDEGLEGCRIPVHRAYDNSTGEHFYTTSLAEAGSGGFSVEVANFYDIYAATHSGLTGWYRCLKANGKHFYTTNSVCEGTTVEGVMGYVSTSELPGSTELYRSYNPTSGDHFYTISLTEHQNAVAGNYQDEGVSAYVW